MISTTKLLTVIVVVLALLSISAILYSQFYTMRESYNSEIKYSFSKSPIAYDYSCDQNDQQVYFVIKNVGTKTVSDLSFSISNPLCKGSLPSLPTVLDSNSSISFYAESTGLNGTMTLSGNNTYIQIAF